MAQPAAPSASAHWTLTLHNATSMEWFVQVARAVEISADEAATGTAAAQIVQTVMTQSSYAVPQNGLDRLRVSVPDSAQFSVAALQSRADGSLAVLSGTELPSPALGRSFLLSQRGRAVSERRFEPFIPEDAVGVAATAEGGCIGLLQDGAIVGAVAFPAATPASPTSPTSPASPASPSARSAAASSATQLRVLPGAYWRIVATRAPSGCVIAQPLSAPGGDWRPLAPEAMRAGAELVVRLSMDESYNLTYVEELTVDEEEAAAHVLPLPSSKSSNMVLTGDSALPSTQLALLVLLEKEVASFRFRLVRTASLPLNHPYRRDHGRMLPFLNATGKPRQDGGEVTSALGIARRLEAGLFTGARLVPFGARERAAMDQWIQRIENEMMPLVDTLLTELTFGPAQGHRTDARTVAQTAAALASVLDDFSAALVQPADAHKQSGVRFLAGGDAATLADLALLPALSMLARTSQGQLVSDRPNLQALLLTLQKRRAWMQLQQWLEAHAGETAEKFVRAEDGAPFHG